MSRIAILTYGTRGDVQPVLSIGDALRRRGHSVALTVNENLAAWAERSGLEIFPMPPDTEAILKSTEGRQLLADGRAAAFARFVASFERSANEEMTRACLRCVEGADIVVSNVMTLLRGCAIAEASRLPHGCLMTMPLQPTSEYAMLLAPIRRFPFRSLNRMSFRLGYQLWWRSNAEVQADTRALLGLPPDPSRPLFETLPSVGIYSTALKPRPSDWDERHAIAGFTRLRPELREKLGERTPPERLEAWLDAGEPPVYFGLGSMPALDPSSLLPDIALVTERLGLRAIVGAGWSDYGREEVPEHVFVASAFDHDRYLPLCRAAVHHGGAGTTAAALRAGLPSLVLSVKADQPFWGWRVTEAGVGATLPFRKLSVGAMRRALERILQPGVAARAAELGARLRTEQGEEVAADTIEKWLRECQRAGPAGRPARPWRGSEKLTSRSVDGTTPL